MRRIVVGITGSTGAIYGVRLLEVLRRTADVETHLILSAPGKRTLVEETDRTVKDVEALAHAVYDNRDIGCALASGSFRTAGMAIAPCSIKTASALAHCYSDTLVARAGDVALKEGRPLVAVVRETPLHVGHLRDGRRRPAADARVLPEAAHARRRRRPHRRADPRPPGAAPGPRPRVDGDGRRRRVARS